MPFCKNHDHIYFDNLCRTKKAETVLSLIYATDQAKKNCKGDKSREKDEIAKHLVSAYQLFKFDSGTYSGTQDQFQSQYTIGHELGIWKNSDLDLTPLAKKVADGKVTIREYFDIVFLNYVQPINGKIVHILANILQYLISENKTTLNKDDIERSFPGTVNKSENIRAVYQMLLGTSYFTELSDCLQLNYEASDILECCNLEYVETDYADVKKKFDNLEEYLKYLLADHRSEKLLLRRSRPVPVNSGSVQVNSVNNAAVGYNKIFYGIPGCGKSWRIENIELKKVDKKKDVFRTTFFLDYSNSDFVGQIYPEVDGDKVKYEYVPGPFTKALERALTVEDDHMIYLVIEEINRGNAAAIFGDLFQLLDRLGKEKDGRFKGDSEYPISNTFIEGYFKKNGVPFEKGNIYIPHNLTLLATMNTSDQNVYPLDTAFQRRWDREKVVSKLNGSKYATLYVPGTKYTWEQFASSINTCMIDGCKDGSVTEDKNLGAYFATEEMLCTKEENERNDDEGKDIRHKKAIRFANNVLEYLFGTAVKFSPEILFDKEYKRYQQVYDNVDKYSYVISDNSSDDKKSEWFIEMLSDIVKEKIEKNSSPASSEDGE